MVGLPVKTVARNMNCLFQRFFPFFAIQVSHNNVRLHINTMGDYKMHALKMER
jgi:hypothetical protein